MSAWTEAPRVRAFLTAVQFLTQLPVPGGATRDLATFPEDIRRGLAYFPLIGALIGLITAVALSLSALVLPFALAVVVALAVEARVTGAFHEDAVADFCDAFGGGWTREDTLRILKDSRIGSFGALGLGLAVALRAIGLMAIGDFWLACMALVVSGALGRLAILAVMALVPPVPAREGLSKDVGQVADWSVFCKGAMLVLPVVLPALFLDWIAILLSFVMITAFVIWMRALLMRWLGGVTGDCLGFTAYAAIVLTTIAFARLR
ncbi:MAG: adenosylcobinamide-GDP ribazoletransferase [Hyphomicrobium sp.]|nr:adenosylcobinamide-GDP ribazoletransferase [Hyphomicrobium sp.]